ncbi:MAG: sigma-54 dependent transcriptional regulator [Myxococcales bacterium]|nr:sigma-54 dependent transcriptional regulator [Myxococcales bacterium]
MGRVLIVDDERGIREALELLLEGRGHHIHLAHDVESARVALFAQSYDLVITDLRLSPDGPSGMDVLRISRDLPDPPEVIVMTAYGTREHAQQVIAQGAVFYIEKGPHLATDVDVLAHQAITKRQLALENAELRRTLLKTTHRSGMVGKSEAFTEMLDLLERLAPLRTTVLICGESGTGKERVARALHEGASWSDGPFVPLNCGALPSSIIESELFGYTKGAFTGAESPKVGVFEASRGGTLFLDEIGEIPLELQSSLLRVLQERKVRRLGSAEELSVEDVRVVVATNRNLEADVADGKFREDLFFRLNVVQVDLPPLRERPEDIVLLAEHFLEKFARAHERPVTSIAPAAMDCLTRFRYPGNVRQLENIVERGVALAKGDCLSVAELPKRVREVEVSVDLPMIEELSEFPKSGVDLEKMLDRFELSWIERALMASGGVKTHAAELLGLSFRQFRYKLSKHRRTTAGDTNGRRVS